MQTHRGPRQVMEYGRLGKTAQEDLGTEEYADSLYKVRDSDVSEDPF